MKFGILLFVLSILPCAAFAADGSLNCKDFRKSSPTSWTYTGDGFAKIQLNGGGTMAVHKGVEVPLNGLKSAYIAIESECGNKP